jgi:hypothetical protein
MLAQQISRSELLASQLSRNGTVLRSYEEKYLAVEEQREENHLTMAATTTSSFLLRAAAHAAPVYPAPVKRRRSIDPQTGRALVMLGHAIEYLADEYVEHGGQLAGSDGQIQAMQLLMALNREIYTACPEIPTLEERFTAFVRRFWN